MDSTDLVHESPKFLSICDSLDLLMIAQVYRGLKINLVQQLGEKGTDVEVTLASST